MPMLAQIKEQTEHLLEKQKESQETCMQKFQELFDAINQAKARLKDKEALEKVEEIRDILQDYAEAFKDEVDEDIEFLQSQLDTLDVVSEEDDQAKRQEMVDLMLDGGELVETATFKKQLEEDTIRSMQEFETVLDDFKNAIAEGEYDQLLTYLHEMVAEQFGEEDEEEGAAEESEDDEDFEDDEEMSLFGGCCDDDEADGKEDSCCGQRFSCGDACVCKDDCGHS